MSEAVPEPDLEEFGDVSGEEGDAGVNDTGDEPWYQEEVSD